MCFSNLSTSVPQMQIAMPSLTEIHGKPACHRPLRLRSHGLSYTIERSNKLTDTANS